MNGLLTVAVLTTLYMIGFQVDASLYDRPIIGAVDPGSPAALAGLTPGDQIVAIDGRPLASWEEAQYQILLKPEALLELRVLRDGAERVVSLRSGSTSAEKVGTIGVHPLVRVGVVLDGAPAQTAGLRPDDAILRIDATPLRNFAEIPPLVGAAEGRTLVLHVWRAGQSLELPVVPRDDGSGPRIGIAPKMVVKQFGFVRAVGESLRWSWSMTQQTADVLTRLVTAQLSPKTMMGPLGIAKASGDAARGGAGPLFYLVAVISLQIGLLNLVPLPPLDGGHLAILASESVLRRDISLQVKVWVMNAGAAVLFLLIGLVLYSDLSKTSWLGKYLP
jgi:regulator of sigma E protease